MTLIEMFQEIEAAQAELAAHEKAAKEKSGLLRQIIADKKTAMARTGAGIDMDKLRAAEAVMYTRGYVNRGQDGESAINDAIKWFATGKSNSYLSLKVGYYGTKNYDRWYGQRNDSEYGTRPRHGSTVFEIGLKADARKRALTDEEKNACIYYLMNLAQIDATKVAA